MKRVMIDIETLGRKPGCVILSIGAVIFDENSSLSKLDDGFYEVIDYFDSMKLGFDTEEETWAWWKSQPPAAKEEVFFNPRARGMAETLRQFSEWLHSQAPEEFWANDPQFDFAILDKALGWAGMMPVSGGEYWRERAFRTQMANTPALYEQYRAEKSQTHIAIEDARRQAHWTARSISMVQDAIAKAYPHALSEG